MAIKNGFFVEGHVLRRNANPGALVSGRDDLGREYPQFGGYVDFVDWASEYCRGASYEVISEAALREGWRVAEALARKKHLRSAGHK